MSQRKLELVNEGNARSPSEVGDYVGILVHCNSSGTIVTVI